MLEVSNEACTRSKIDEGVLLSLHEHQNFLFNKVDLKLPIVSTEGPVLIGVYVDDITLGCLFVLVWIENLNLLNKMALHVISTHF